MTHLRSLLAIIFLIIALYTGGVILHDGLGLIPAFLGGILSMTWQGQFNLDFACYLALSALWVAWRSGYSGPGIALALIASVAGMLFFAPLALGFLARSGGDPRRFLLGVHAGA